jgi:GNAT superfamily N-acetyltransferase
VTALVVRPVTADRWGDLVAVFGPNGAYSNCWCAFFRRTGAEFAAGCRESGTGNRDLLRRLVREGEVPGLLAYRDRVPVGWVSVGPRPAFGRYLRSPITRLDPEAREDGTVWSVVCLYVPRAERRRGVARALVAGAVDWARARGAAVVEGYPVDTNGQRRPSAELYVGTVPLFAELGFREVARRVPSRPVMQLALG